jgi:hypothetical protein
MFGGSSGISFAMITSINNWLRGEEIVQSKLWVGSTFALVVFGIVGTFTGKIGSEFGDS